MALPLAPIAGVALRYGAVALAGYVLFRDTHPARRDQRAEDVCDDMDEGVALRRDPGQTQATGRMRRVVRLGRTGPGVEIDAAVFGRLRLRRR